MATQTLLPTAQGGLTVQEAAERTGLSEHTLRYYERAGRGYAAASPRSPLAPFTFERRAPGPKDVHIDLLFYGVCHSDLHQARDEWGGSLFPMVPGHEIVGRVKEVGAEVTRFAAGDMVGVGCMVDSCRHCADCREGLEQFCQNTLTLTYNSPIPFWAVPRTADTPTRSWWTRISCCACPRSCLRPPRLPSFEPESRRIPRFAIGRSAPGSG